MVTPRFFNSAMIRIFLFLGIILCGCTSPPYLYKGEQYKGISFVAPLKAVNDSAFHKICAVNASCISLMPYSFCKPKEARLYHGGNTKWQWWGESKDGILECIKMAHKAKLKAILKPHSWMEDGAFTGDFKLQKEEEWQTFEKDFEDYILDFAKIADSTHIEIFCIGTELHSFVEARPQFWQQLIEKVRLSYKGKITYAENWDKYPKFPFWNKLDFIGVDAYFPLTEEANPSINSLKEGWKKHIAELEQISAQHQKPILFTEFGYCSTEFTTQKPWEEIHTHSYNEDAQNTAYLAIFESVWTQKWFAGGFAWKWFPNPDYHHSERDLYSPQNKKAENTLKMSYLKNWNKIVSSAN